MRLYALAAASFAGLLLFSENCLAHRVNVFAFVDGGAIRVEGGFAGGKKVNGGKVVAADAETGEIVFEGATDARGECSFRPSDEFLQTGHALTITLLAGQGHRDDWTMTPEELRTLSPVEGMDNRSDANQALRASTRAGQVRATPSPSPSPPLGGEGIKAAAIAKAGDTACPKRIDEYAPSPPRGGEGWDEGTEIPSEEREFIVESDGAEIRAGTAGIPDAVRDARAVVVDAAELEAIVGKAVDEKLLPVKLALARSVDDGPTVRDVVGGLGWILGLLGLATYLKYRGRKRHDDGI